MYNCYYRRFQSLNESFTWDEIFQVLVPGLIELLSLNWFCHDVSEFCSVKEITGKLEDAIWPFVQNLAYEKSYQPLKLLVLSEVPFVRNS